MTEIFLIIISLGVFGVVFELEQIRKKLDK